MGHSSLAPRILGVNPLKGVICAAPLYSNPNPLEVRSRILQSPLNANARSLSTLRDDFHLRSVRSKQYSLWQMHLRRFRCSLVPLTSPGAGLYWTSLHGSGVVVTPRARNP